MNLKDADLLSKVDVESLISGAVPEKLKIEYKEKLPTWSEGGKKEFLADISSFANSAGGHIFYGISEKRENGQPTGIPDEALGLAEMNAIEKGKVEQMILMGIRPRLHGIKMHLIEGFPKGSMFVIQVPKSWSGPHAVWFQENSKFWGRNTHGKYQLDVGQIGGAFLSTDTVSKAIKEFRMNRIALIGAGETPVPLANGQRLTVHMIPLAIFNERNTWSVPELQTAAAQILLPMTSGNGYDHRTNLDGFLRHSGIGGQTTRWGYVQLYRNGIIEACDTILLGGIVAADAIPSKALENGLISSLSAYLKVQKNLGVELPIVFFVTIEGVMGRKLAVNNNPFNPFGSVAIDRDKLFIPEVVIEDFKQSVGQILRPIFDSIYNAAGFDSCPRYNTAGEYDSSLSS